MIMKKLLFRPHHFAVMRLAVCVGVKGLVRGLRHNRLSYCLIVQRLRLTWWSILL